MGKTILTITGSDGTGGSGVQADTKTMSALGCYAVSAITSITVQNTIGIQEFYDIPSDVVTRQIEAIINDIEPSVIKIGMMRSVEVVEHISAILKWYKCSCVIYDPVIVSTRGDILMTDEVIEAVKRRLLPLCNLVVMKRKDMKYFIGGQELNDYAKIMKYGCGALLLQDNLYSSGAATDLLYNNGEEEPQLFSSLASGFASSDFHGIGGELSSAIAAFVCREHSLRESVMLAYTYMNQQLLSYGGLVGRSSDLYNEFIKEIGSHCSTNNDVKFYADKLNVSSRYLAQVTKRIAGKAPKNIIDEYVEHEVEVLLATSDMTVQEIAYRFGFSSQAHFSRFFRKMTGQTASEYRKRILNK